jgi:hypothetical protein
MVIVEAAVMMVIIEDALRIVIAEIALGMVITMAALRLVITEAVPRDTHHRDLMKIVMIEAAFWVVIKGWSSRRLHEDGCSRGDDTEYGHL